MVDWVTTAWLELAKKVDAVKKSFLVTDISNALGGYYEDELVWNDELKAEIDRILEFVLEMNHLMEWRVTKNLTHWPLTVRVMKTLTHWPQTEKVTITSYRCNSFLTSIHWMFNSTRYILWQCSSNS